MLDGNQLRVGTGHGGMGDAVIAAFDIAGKGFSDEVVELECPAHIA